MKIELLIEGRAKPDFLLTQIIRAKVYTLASMSASFHERKD
jgi:hypothetical protein